MSYTNQPNEPYNNQYQQQPIAYRANYKPKKKRSWVSLIIQIIVLVLTAIAGYSMWKQPIFNIVFANKPVNFDGLKHFQDTTTNIGNLNINLGNVGDLQQSLDRLIMVFNAFFILCIVSLIITILTIIFNRTVLKVLNIFSLAIMLVITLYFSYIIKTLAQKIAESFKQYYISVSPQQVITEADAIHNGIILLGCSIALIVISLFFRNRKLKLQ
ncbi:hypothetical protein J3T65_03835 [Staphylococcus simiae]|uniref:hypothetical protein n=1 Tax=Staphylococcus simiae TaxID=308354 RepID=UPI001A95D8BB|nr:hypothetical protein [Staphylococcus simiae]MBO1198663.1 hypothetical protein [Staphylococcus simiae]MBO1200852.1 hypothetical protein [Staphylococcus simiae]MBO1203060.1 hypothetical protein [Staphylococcus simiae]MBO1211289.1 hypothetical protein [Staphylococcus simiae]MBO1229188.1 hypothetical protein [Staphylococcus simiae]